MCEDRAEDFVLPYELLLKSSAAAEMYPFSLNHCGLGVGKNRGVPKISMRQRVKTLLLWLVSIGGVSQTEHSAKRNVRILATTFSGVFGKGVMIVSNLIMVPLTLRYLGEEMYGLWLTISSVILMLYLSDLGIGLGLLNAVSAAYGKDDEGAARRCVSSSFIGITGLVLVGGLVLFSCRSLVPIEWVLGVKDSAAANVVRPTLTAALLAFALNLPLTLVEPVYQGYQEGYLYRAWHAFGCVCTVVALLICVRLRASLPVLAFCLMAGPALANLCGAAFLFLRKPGIRPRIRYFDKSTFKSIAGDGFLFFGVKITSVLIVSLPAVLISHLLGPKAVTPYQICFKLFMIVPYMVGMYYASLWPAYREAATRGDWKWVRSTFRLAAFISAGAACVAGGLLFFFGQSLIKWWVGSTVIIGDDMRSGFCVWIACCIYGGLVSSLLNALGKIRIQLIFGSICAVGALVFQWYATPLWGPTGTIWALSTAYILFIALPLAAVVFRVFRDQIAPLSEET